MHSCLKLSILSGVLYSYINCKREKRKGQRSFFFLFISVAFDNLLNCCFLVFVVCCFFFFLCTRLCRPCQGNLQTTHFLFKKCMLNGVSVWSLVWIKFYTVPAWVSFHLKSGRKEVTEGKTTKPTFRVYVLSPSHSWGSYELIMSLYEANTLVTKVFICFDVLLQ